MSADTKTVLCACNSSFGQHSLDSSKHKFKHDISRLFSHGNVDRRADALIRVAINLKLMILEVDF